PAAGRYARSTRGPRSPPDAWVATSHAGEKGVLVSPHHALRHTGCAARVEDITIVPRPGAEVAHRRGRVHGCLIVRTCGKGPPQGRRVRFDFGDPISVLRLVDGANQVGVVEQVTQFPGDIPIV